MALDLPSLSNATGSTSSNLLKWVRAGDPQAWEHLAKAYGPVVYGWARQCGLQESDAADVTQETFRAVSLKIDTFQRNQPSDSFRGWLWTITRNKIRDHFRDLSLRVPAVGGEEIQAILAQLPSDSPEPASSAESAASTADHITRHTLDLLQAEFEPRTWQAFWRVAVEDQKPADVAASLQMTLGAVYMAKSRVLKRLRAELSELEGEP